MGCLRRPERRHSRTDEESKQMMHWSRRRLSYALVLLGACVGGQYALASRLGELRGAAAVPLVRPLDEFPDYLGDWTGAELPADDRLKAIVEKIRCDAYMQRVYVHRSGEKVVLWMNYSTRSTDQFHYPTVCMVAGGWEEDEAARSRIEADAKAMAPKLDAGLLDHIPIMRMLFNRRAERQAVYYWYYLMGEDKIDKVMRRLSQSSRAFLRGRRNTSLTVEVFSQSPAPDVKLLDDFARRVSIQMIGWMPKGTESACELGANY